MKNSNSENKIIECCSNENHPVGCPGFYGYKKLSNKEKCFVCNKRKESFISTAGLIHCTMCALLKGSSKIQDNLTEVDSLYTDGGLLGMNKHGGTWAWVGVKNGYRVFEACGRILNTDSVIITNNHTEQIAICLALEAMPDGWSGTVYSDSKIALGRVFENWATKNLPRSIILRSQTALKRLGTVKYELLQGHPTESDLKLGIGKKRLYPVSIHNVRCDQLCEYQRKEYYDTISRL